MTPTEVITKLAQSAYLAVTGNYNNVSGTALTTFLNKTIDWTNQFTNELELEADWNYLRQNDYNLGIVNSATQYSVPLPDEVRKIVVSPYRDLVLSYDGVIISRFRTVNPNQIADPRNPVTMDRVTQIGRNLVFSRAFTEEEVSATIQTDVINFMPELSLTDTDVLDLVQPHQLLILGLAKNISLPDLVRGGTSPSFVQKYNKLLRQAVMENNATAEAYEADRESFSYINGVW
jgi:hypothetical protein